MHISVLPLPFQVSSINRILRKMKIDTFTSNGIYTGEHHSLLEGTTISEFSSLLEVLPAPCACLPCRHCECCTGSREEGHLIWDRAPGRSQVLDPSTERHPTAEQDTLQPQASRDSWTRFSDFFSTHILNILNFRSYLLPHLVTSQSARYWTDNDLISLSLCMEQNSFTINIQICSLVKN